jgi:hypothetical protein
VLRGARGKQIEKEVQKCAKWRLMRKHKFVSSFAGSRATQQQQQLFRTIGKSESEKGNPPLAHEHNTQQELTT